jgi:hypothetical protein
MSSLTPEHPVVASGEKLAVTVGITQMVLVIISVAHELFFTFRETVYVPGSLYVTVKDCGPGLEVNEVPKFDTLDVLVVPVPKAAGE